MATETDINLLLAPLEALLKQVRALTTEVERIATTLEQAEREYSQKLDGAIAEADRLEGEKRSLIARLNRAEAPGPLAPPPADERAGIEPVPPPPLTDTTIKLPAPPREKPERQRKRALADFIFNFSDSGSVIEKINALVDDDARDIGEMLELIEWGQIWKERTKWESDSEQFTRLEEWRVALEHRLAFLTEKKSLLENNSLWEERSRSDEEWQSFLDEILQQRKAENERTVIEIGKLEEQWQARREAALEVNNG